jgi:hypothetical protein
MRGNPAATMAPRKGEASLRKTFLSPGGHDNRLKMLVSDKRIKGNQSLFLGKIWQDSASTWLGLENLDLALQLDP